MNTDTHMSGSTVKNHISFKNGIRRQCNTENFVPIVVPGLPTSSSSSLPSSTPMTFSTVSSESVDKQERGEPVRGERVEMQER